MNNASAILKSLIIYVVCIPLAIWLGFLLTGPVTRSSLGIFGIVVAILCFPLLLRWHYQFLLVTFNAGMVIFFLPGTPNVILVAITLSMGISILQRTLDKDMRFMTVPQIIWPLVCMVVVVLVTAELTGGFGLRALGSEVYGGKKYVYLLAAIASYFALTARRIPVERAKIYVGLFFLGGIAQSVGDLYSIAPSWLNFIFWVFPPNGYVYSGLNSGMTRFSGAVATATGITSYMLAKYGFRGIFLAGKPWRWVFFVLICGYGLLGGFRSLVVIFVLTFTVQFFIEGLQRTKLMPIFAMIIALGMVSLIPLAPHLPYTFQRALSFLPLNIDAAARQDADYSWEWRVKMWEALLPEVPHYLLLGKGYAFDRQDYLEMGRDAAIRSFDAGQQGLAIAGDYHNGPLSLVLPFGIWGLIVFVWFIAAGINVVYCNYRYGDPALKMINTFLLTVFIIRVVFFFFFYGAFNSDMMMFAGLVGLSIALNGGKRGPNMQPVEEKAEHRIIPFKRPQLFQPAFQRLKD